MRTIYALCLISFLQIFCSCNQRAEPAIYLIPSSFTGKVNVIFSQDGIPVKYKNDRGQDTIYFPATGQPIKYENGRRVYEIPLSGILLTQFKSNDGFIDRKYFSVDSFGKRVLLDVFQLEHPQKDSTRWIINDVHKKGIFGDGTSGSYGNMNIHFQDFIVSNYSSLDSFYAPRYVKNFNDKISKITSLNL